MQSTFSGRNETWLSSLADRAEEIDRSAVSIRADLDALGATRMAALPIHLLVDADESERMSAAALTIFRAQTAVLRGLVDEHGNDVLARFGLPRSLTPLVDHEALLSERTLYARVDVIPSAEGFHFCEFNVDSSISGFEFHSAYRDHAGRLGMTDFEGTEDPMTLLAENVAREYVASGRSRLVIIDWSSRDGCGYLGFEPFLERLRLVLPDAPIALRFHREAADAASADTFVYRGFMREDMDDDGAFLHALVAAGARVDNLFESEIRTSKLWMAMLHDPEVRAGLDDAALSAIDTYLPLTRRVTPHEAPGLLDERGDWVFKEARSSGGHDVLLGDAWSRSELAARLAADPTALWLAQRRVHSEPVSLPHTRMRESAAHHVVLGLYVVGDRAAGLNVRADPTTAVVNIHQSAASGWAVPVPAASAAGR